MLNADTDTRRLTSAGILVQIQVYVDRMKQVFSIGVTGHRPNRLPEAARARIQDQIRGLLDIVTALSVRWLRRPILISALAEGSDRMVAEAALERGIQLAAVLPFQATEYAHDFSDEASQTQFRALLESAVSVKTVPNSGQDRESAYEAAGIMMLDVADVLIAVWDGGPAAGRGGTGEIVEHARRRGLPVLVVDATAATPPRLLSGTGSIEQAVAEAMNR
jgi:hypothetical protein